MRRAHGRALGLGHAKEHWTMPFERFGDGPHWWTLAAMGFSTLFWLALLGVLVWAASRYLGRRQSEPVPVVDAEPAAVELLRRPHALGQIAAETPPPLPPHLLLPHPA